MDTAGLTLDDIDIEQDKFWRVGVKKRLTAFFTGPYRGVLAEELIELEYLTMFAGPAGNVHGDWADLVLNHLRRENDGFLPDLEGGWPEVASMLRFSQYITGCLRAFVARCLPRTEDTEGLLAVLDDFMGRVNALDNYLDHQNARGQLLPGTGFDAHPANRE